MQAIARCEELKSNGFFLTFLQEKDLKLFTQKQKDMEKLKDKIKSRPYTQLTTFNGSAKVFLQPGSHSQKFCNTMNDYVDSYEILQRAMINVSKELSTKASDFLATVEEMQRLT